MLLHGSQWPLLLPGIVAVAVFLLWTAKGGGYATTVWYPSALVFLALSCFVVLWRLSRCPRPVASVVAAGLLLVFTFWSFASIAWSADRGIVWEIAPDDLARLSIAQSGKYVLIEVPYRGWPQSLPAALAHLRRLGMTAMLAHPERNPEVQDRPDRLAAVVRDGALVQITSASLDGLLGQAANTAAEHLLELELVHVLASDVHGPHVRGGFADALSRIADDALRRYLTMDAPAAIVVAEPLPPKPS